MPCEDCEREKNECCSECCEHFVCPDCAEHLDETERAACDEGHCEGCCNCVQCNGCSCHYLNRDEFCDNCEFCSRCCNCFTCDNCGDRVYDESFCSDCDCCNNCCNCSGDNLRLEGMFRFHPSGPKEFKHNPLKRFISLEIEIASASETYSTASACNQWRNAVVEDGSLPNSGFEINTNPTNGDKFIEHIEQMGRALDEDGADVTSDCGLHCHVDASDYTWFDLYKLCMLYGKIEDGLFSIVARSRRNAHYSQLSASQYNFSGVPLSEFKHLMLNRLYGRNFKNSYQDGMVTYKGKKKVFIEKTSKYENCRYYALNLHSFFYRGTIEFRHHHGTVNAEKMTNWGLICGWIVERGNTLNIHEIRNLPADPIEALKTILPPHLAKWVDVRVGELKKFKE